MDRHAATRRLRHLAQTAGIYVARTHPHMLRHTFVTTTLDAGVDLRDVQIAARHAGPGPVNFPLARFADVISIFRQEQRIFVGHVFGGPDTITMDGITTFTPVG